MAIPKAAGQWTYEDLLVEILSPSDPAHDRIEKREWYERAGVREYWIVSPEEAVIEVLTLRQGAYRTLVFAGGEETVKSAVLPEVSFSAAAIFR